jgi:hypothetical protein
VNEATQWLSALSIYSVNSPWEEVGLLGVLWRGQSYAFKIKRRGIRLVGKLENVPSGRCKKIDPRDFRVIQNVSAHRKNRSYSL